MSAFGARADIDLCAAHVCFCPKADGDATSPVAPRIIERSSHYLRTPSMETSTCMSFDVGPLGNRKRNAESNNYGSTQKCRDRDELGLGGG